MANPYIPANSEQYLAGCAESARLAVVIDLLSRMGGGFGSPGESYGIAGLPFTSANASAAAVAVTSAPVVGDNLMVDGVTISVGATAQAVTFTEETSGTVIFGPIYMAANSSITLAIGRLLPTINKRLMVQDSAAGNISILAAYRSVAP